MATCIHAIACDVLSVVVNSGPVTVKEDTANCRRFIPAWKAHYRWVFLNEQRNGMCCRYCVNVGKHAFTTAAGCCHYKKDALRKHAMTADHRAAVEARSYRRDMEQAVSRLIGAMNSPSSLRRRLSTSWQRTSLAKMRLAMRVRAGCITYYNCSVAHALVQHS